MNLHIPPFTPFAALTLALWSCPIHAEVIGSGTYDIVTDGARGTLTIEGGKAEIAVAGPRCFGGMEGQFEQDSTESRIVGDGCTISLAKTSDAKTQIVQGQGCSMYHGISCAFSGTVIGPALPLSMEALNQGFARLSETERRALQSTLQTRGLYTSAIDGRTGPGTRGAIVDMAREMHAEDTMIRLDTAASAEEVMRRMMAPADPITLDANLPFMGRYDCDGSAEIVFRPNSYTTGNIDLQYANLVDIGDTLWGIEFRDGYRISVEADGSGWITWHSPGSGDTFRCRKMER